MKSERTLYLGMRDLIEQPSLKARAAYLEIMQTPYVGRLSSVASSRLTAELLQTQQSLSQWIMSASEILIELFNELSHGMPWPDDYDYNLKDVTFQLIRQLYNASEGKVCLTTQLSHPVELEISDSSDGSAERFEVCFNYPTDAGTVNRWIIFRAINDEWDGLALSHYPFNAAVSSSPVLDECNDHFEIDFPACCSGCETSYEAYDVLIHITTWFQERASASKEEILSIISSLEACNNAVSGYVRDSISKYATVTRNGWMSVLSGIQNLFQEEVEDGEGYAAMSAVTVALTNLPYVVFSVISTVVQVTLMATFHVIGMIVSAVINIFSSIYQTVTNHHVDSEILDEQCAENILSITSGPSGVITDSEASALVSYAYQTDTYEQYIQRVRYVDYRAPFAIYLPFMIIYLIPESNSSDWKISSYLRAARCQSFDAAASSVVSLYPANPTEFGLTDWLSGCYNDAGDSTVPFQPGNEIRMMASTSVLSIINSLLRYYKPTLDDDFGGEDPYSQSNQYNWESIFSAPRWYLKEFYWASRAIVNGSDDYSWCMSWQNLVSFGDMFTNRTSGFGVFGYYRAMCQSRYNYSGIVASGRNYIAPIDGIRPTIIPPLFDASSLKQVIIGLGLVTCAITGAYVAARRFSLRPLSLSAARYKREIDGIMKKKSALSQQDGIALTKANRRLSTVYRIGKFFGYNNLNGVALPSLYTSPIDDSGNFIATAFGSWNDREYMDDGSAQQISDLNSVTLLDIKHLIVGSDTPQ